ncbi:MAG: FtsX-like permease family protein [Phycisphaerae bacterium]|nr:FtsX-like permease family protein [Phycisphaerae bacterium]
MIGVALRMLFGDRAKYFGLIFGVTFASLVLTQQPAIFWGLMTRTYGFITDAGLADAWVMDPKVQFIDDIKPLQDTQLYRVRSVPGVGWAVPLYKGLLRARLENGSFQSCNVIGLDDSTLIGGPATMLEGRLEDLRRADSVIVDDVGAATRLARPPRFPGDPPIPLRVGDLLELNDRRAVVVGICKVSRTFQSQPVVYTTYSRATSFAPRERKLLSFILVGGAPGQDPAQLCARIEAQTGLAAYPREDFKWKTVTYFLKYTGIPINFGISVTLGFLVGLAIVGQTFYTFTLDNLRHFGALKAMGAGNGTLLRMIVTQALVVGLVGWGLGTGAGAMFGYVFRESQLAFRLPIWVLVLSASAVLLITIVSSVLSLWKVMRLEPAIVFKS